MAKSLKLNVVWILVVLIVAVEADTPPGIANHPSHARCLIKKYKHCYNLEHVCPKFCPDSCTVECVSCKPICSGGSTPAPPEDGGSEGGDGKDNGNGGEGNGKGDDDGNGKGDEGKDKGDDKGKGNGKGDDKGEGSGKGDEGKATPPSSSPPVAYPPPTPSTPETPATPTPPTPTPSPPTPTPSPPTPTPSPPTPRPSPPTQTPSPPTATPSPPTPTPSPPTPTPSPPTQTPSPPTPTPTPTPPSSPTPSTPSSPTSSPTPPSHTPSPTPPTWYSPPPRSTDVSASRRRRCKNKEYPQCYGVEHVCPSSCPTTCEVDCNTCKPVCTCDYPGAVCQDPRFIGGDGITFYFHGKKDRDFCLVTDPNLHINAHFIGRRNQNMKRDFTWVKSIGVLFDNHNIFIGAKKTATWDDANDRLALTLDGAAVALPETDGAKWQSETVPSTTMKRDADTNSVIIEIEGIVKITAKVVPITEHESRVHNYGITKEDCFAHLELAFKFYSLNENVNGVLGQTYRSDYVSRAKMGVSMPVVGGEKEFAVSSLYATDCAVSQFIGGGKDQVSAFNLELPSMKCGSGMDGRGVVCKK